MSGQRVGKKGAATALALGLLALQAPGARAWTIVPRPDSVGIGIRFEEGRWSGQLMVPSTDGSPIGRDKIQHALAGAAIATAFRLVGAEASTAMGAALLAGTVKEVGDSGRIPGLPRGHVELGDWVATGLGGLLAVWSTQAGPMEAPRAEAGRQKGKPDPVGSGRSARDGT